LLRLWIVRVCKLASFRGRCLKTCQGNVKRGKFSLQNVTSTIQDHIAMFERGHQESVLPSPIDMGPIEDLAVTIIRGWSR